MFIGKASHLPLNSTINEFNFDWPSQTMTNGIQAGILLWKIIITPKTESNKTGTLEHLKIRFDYHTIGRSHTHTHTHTHPYLTLYHPLVFVLGINFPKHLRPRDCGYFQAIWRSLGRTAIRGREGSSSFGKIGSHSNDDNRKFII